MPTFEQHDGKIIIRTDQGEYTETEVNFVADYGAPIPSLPQGFIGRIYEPGIRHHAVARNKHEPQGLSWAEGDTIIEAYDSIVSARNLRKNPIPNLTKYKIIKGEEAKGLGRERVFQDYDEQDQRRLGLMDSGNSERTSARNLIIAVKAEVDRVRTLISSRNSKAAVDTAFNSLSLPA